MNRRVSSLLCAAMAASQLGATDCGEVITDSGFDLWCGPSLCAWSVVSGTIVQAPTWHDGDIGVSLVADNVALEQFAPLSSQDGSCVEFDMVTNIAADAEVHLQMDVFSDGIVDYDVRIPTASWAPVSYRVVFAPPFQGITFRLVKTGTGAAVLAQLEAKVVEGCTGAAVPLPARPLGAFCSVTSDCRSGVCNGPTSLNHLVPVCGACATDAQCGPGLVCGTTSAPETFLVDYRACVPAASHDLGELCAEDAECATGICNGASCATCDTERGCPTGQTCDAATSARTTSAGVGVIWPTSPTECSPGAGRIASGDFCLADGDCTSGACTGADTLRVCVSGSDQSYTGDGRTCRADSDCPENGKHVHGPCVAVGTLGGLCR